MNTFLLLGIHIVFVFIISSGCATNPLAPQSDPKQTRHPFSDSLQVSPEILRQYPQEQYLFGFGQAESEQAAIELARADVAKKIRVRVTALARDVIREQGEQTDQMLSRTVTTQSNEMMRQTRIADLYHNPDSGLVHAVVVLPKLETDDPAQAQQDSTETPSTDPIWVTAEGIVQFGPDTTLAEAGARSREKARHQAVEKAVGVFVNGRTLVYNTTVAENIVTSMVRGIIIEEHILDEGLRSTGQYSESVALLYSTKLRAKVKPVSLKYAKNLKVDVILNRTVFQEGDEVQVTITPSQDTYVYILNVRQDDNVTLLFPNKFSQDNFLSAHSEFVFPDESQRNLGIRLRVELPRGKSKSIEKVKVVASEKQVDLLDNTRRNNTFMTVARDDQFKVTDLMKQLALAEETTWTDTTIPYEIRR